MTKPTSVIKGIILLLYFSILSNQFVNAKSGTEYFEEKYGAHLGFNVTAGVIIVSVFLGTPLFFIVNFFVTRYEKSKKDELELQEIKQKSYNRRKMNLESSNGAGGGGGGGGDKRQSDFYGTNKILRECISRNNSVSQLFVSSSPSISGQSGNSTSVNAVNISPLNQSQNSISTGNTPSNNTSNNNISSGNVAGVLKSNSIGYLPPIASYNSSNSAGSANNSPRRFNERLITPPSPILSTFGGKKEDLPPIDNDNTPSSSTNLKRTISADSGKVLCSSISTPQPIRPKSLSNVQDTEHSKNATLINLLSSNTVPKDHWHCIVYRIQELAMSYWSPPKYDLQAPLTALTQIELSLQGFSEQEQLKKCIITIEDQKYYSPIIFELYSKLLPLHEFTRSKPSKGEKDLTGVYGVFLIILPSLYNSFINWTNETSEGCRRKFLTVCQENLVDTLSSNDILDKTYIHKTSIHYLTQYIRHLLFYSSKGYNGSTLYKIVDLYHGIADDIDKLLFDNESYEDFEELQKVTNSSSFGGADENPFKIDVQNQDCSLLNIVTSVANRFSHIDNYLEQVPQEHPPINGSLLTLQQQKSIISSCYNHLQTSLSILSATDIFSAKFKVDTIPILKMMLVALNTLEEQVDAGVSVGEMDAGELLEWTNNFTRIATTLNNAILKNSSILMASQIVDNINNPGVHGGGGGVGPTSTLTIESPPNSSSPSPSPSTNHLIRKSAKIKPPSSPFGSPAIMSFLMNETSLHSSMGEITTTSANTTNANGNTNGADPSHPSIHLPGTRERCAQIVQLSQDSIMLTVMSGFSMSSRDLRSPPPPYPNSDSSDPTTNNNTTATNSHLLHHHLHYHPLSQSQKQSLQYQQQQQQQINQVVDFFNDGLGVFFSSIRTNIFCTYILLNPIYELQQS
ncbi:hypothetical protein DFA_00931 [Cavenderia fasciculata]|uniref:Uncharacterized protein n=1 Tax=Cavenderia fasciculata TaxID=261658 RepID=F4PUN9_CACFS|nr:uncharacterized protein DFA_00931 [Cavenderia fasciculata]EGG21058.1 hypothetical protein DFA_00931 [Cavenderia fasciculata]|eukprot:XP_004358908.1 hypothetical protein DFA_00931 [Cavenderia fasciculata]